MPAKEVLGNNVVKAKGSPEKFLSRWAQSPPRIADVQEGRYWFLPEFLDIPYSFCDLLQVESLPLGQVKQDFDPIATLAAPYAEALQSCFITFYGAIGIPNMRTKSIESILK